MAINKMVMDFETTKGVDPATPKPIYMTPSGETGISVTRQTKADDVIGGDIDSGGEPYGTFNDIAGTTNFPMTYERIGYILKAMFGSPTTTGTGPYVHTFTSTIDCLPTFLFQETGAECGGVPQIDRYNGLMAKSIAISMSPSGDYNIGFSYVGMEHRDSVVDGITELDETNKIATATTRIKNEQASLLIDGSTYALAQDFSLNYDRSTTAVNYIGSGSNAGDVYAMKPKATGNISSLFDATLYTKAKNETPLSMALNYTDGTNILKITLGEVKLTFKRESKKIGEKYPVNADFTAFKNTGAELVKVELTNSIASY